MQTDIPIEKFEMWARVDLFGHNIRAGNLSTINTGVEVLYRLDVPLADGTFKTEFYGKGAIYSIMPVGEDVARVIAASLNTKVISYWDLPAEWKEAIQGGQEKKALPEPVALEPDDAGDDPNDVRDDEED